MDTTTISENHTEHRHHCHGRIRHRHDVSELSRPRRLAHRGAHVLGSVIFVVTILTLLALFVAATVAAWGWVIDVVA